MAKEEKEAPAKKPKKARLEAEPAPEEPKAPEERKLPTPREVRAARKADLVAWCEALGLDSEGKVDDLRARLLERLEAGVEEKAAPEVAEAPEEEAEEAEEKEAGKAEAPEARHVARAKPSLDARTKALLRLRARKAAERPTFRRQEWFRYDKFGDEWRKPQGGQSKLRRHFGYRWNIPSVGYRGPREVRGLHPSGFREVLVHNVRELEGVDPALQAVRIAHGVGTRKRELIEKACDDRKIRILNRMVTE